MDDERHDNEPADTEVLLPWQAPTVTRIELARTQAGSGRFSDLPSGSGTV